MSIATLKMPRLGETMEQGEIVGWLVEVGQKFERGQAILEVETDKTVVEYPALGAGLLTKMLAVEGNTVAVGDAIAEIELGAGPDWTQEDQDATEAETAEVPAIPVAAKISDPVGNRLRATPAARRLARNAGIALTAITGTGRRGRIETWDIEETLAKGQTSELRFDHAIAYVASGPLSGPQYLLLHGFAGDHTAFSLLSNGLVKAGSRVVSCDLPGHGATKLEAKGTADLSKNLTEFTRALFGRKPFHLVAHSMGAIPAIALATSIPPASLTLIAPAGLGNTGNSEFLNGMANPKSVKEVRTRLGLLTEKPSGLSPSAIEAVFQELSKNRLTTLAHELDNPVQNLSAELAQLASDVPTRVLIGETDNIINPLDRFGLPPEIAVHGFGNTGHMPHWEHPQAVLAILLATEKTMSV